MTIFLDAGLAFTRSRCKPIICKVHLQGARGRQNVAASVLENPATRSETSTAEVNSEESSGEDPLESSRQNSHQHASSSNGNSMYDGSGSGHEAMPSTDVVDGFTLEINACDEIDDILEIVGDEADVMSGSSLAAALKRYCATDLILPPIQA